MEGIKSGIDSQFYIEDRQQSGYLQDGYAVRETTQWKQGWLQRVSEI